MTEDLDGCAGTDRHLFHFIVTSITPSADQHPFFKKNTLMLVGPWLVTLII